jgi:rhodanese-related sulfurtransferase
MGPFVPDIITDELNLVFGFLIGIAFGFVLEQAGFSSSRKLSGLFYGRDFTVLRVFFTAAITAMLGILILSHFGLLDTEIMYINPTYLWAAIVGGVVMGFGFIIGGYCPGTSVCGAAIGKIDAMVFVLGGVLGVYIFGELYSALEPLYNGSFLGDVTVPATLGISPGLFVLAVIVVAVAAFIITTKIERRVSPSPVSATFPATAHRIAGVAVVLLGVLVVFLPDQKTTLLAQAEGEGFINVWHPDSVNVDELAFRLLDHDASVQLIDIRDSSAFAKLALPGAVNIPVEELFGKRWKAVLGARKTNIFVADQEAPARKAAALARALGYSESRYLSGGFAAFRSSILTTQTASANQTSADQDTHRFRVRANAGITEMIKEQAAGPRKTVTVIKKVSGGCGS